MNNSNDFVIENGVLKEYKGKDSVVTVPDGVTSIGEWAFSNCSGLKSVTLPERLTSIGGRAFYMCSSLISVILPKRLMSIGNYAFSWCENLTSITLPKGLTSIGDEAFEYCKNLTGIILPAHVLTGRANILSKNKSFLVIAQEENGEERILAYGAKSNVSNLRDYSPDPLKKNRWGVLFWKQYDEDLLHDQYKFTVSAKLLGAAGRLLSPTGLSKQKRAAYLAVLQANVKKTATEAVKFGLPQVIRLLIDEKLINPDNETEIKKLLIASKDERFISLAESLGEKTEIKGSNAKRQKESQPRYTVRKFGKDKEVRSYQFEDRVDLVQVDVAEGCVGIGRYAFSGCVNLCDITLPKSLTHIDSGAFCFCSALKYLCIPDGVKEIEIGALERCNNLSVVKMPADLLQGDCKFGSGDFGIVARGENGTVFLAYACKLVTHKLIRNIYFEERFGENNLSNFLFAGNYAGYDLELINNGPVFRYSLTTKLFGALGRLADPKDLTPAVKRRYIDLLNKNLRKLIAVAEESALSELIATFLSVGAVERKKEKILRQLLAASVVPEISALAASEITFAPEEETAAPPSAVNEELRQEYSQKLKEIGANAILKKMKLNGFDLPGILLADGTPAPEEIFRFLIASYSIYGCYWERRDRGEEYAIVPQADAAAKLLRYDSLCSGIDSLLRAMGGPSEKIFPLIGRFGNAEQIRLLTDLWWKLPKRGGGKKACIFASLALSDTKEAISWLAKYGTLNTYFYVNDLDIAILIENGEIYGVPSSHKPFDPIEIPPEAENYGLRLFAELRGITVDEVYSRYLFDFGFDEKGRRAFDLGNVTIEAYLTKELRLELWDAAAGRQVYEIPKKNTDPAKVKQAQNEIADLRRNLKRVLSLRTKTLYADFLDGTAFPAEKWKAAYLRDPFLRRLASLLVWEQAGKPFVVTENGAEDCTGAPVTVTDDPITLLHPMETETALITAWQKYFAARSLKQPFLQIWEPVYRAEEIREDRYAGIPLSAKALNRYADVGIEADWYEQPYYESKYLTLFGFDAKAIDAEEDDQEEVRHLQITFIRPNREWNRRMNAVISVLDSLTLKERIKKDDASIGKKLAGTTLAQITDFISTAQAANAFTALAVLLEYKNAHFAEFDPMDEFTLEVLDVPDKPVRQTAAKSSSAGSAPYKPAPVSAAAPGAPTSTAWMKDRIFVLTGFSDESEASYTQTITAAGGIVKSSTVLATDYVVYNPDYGHETTKLKRAKELIARGKPITILTEEEFLAKQ